MVRYTQMTERGSVIPAVEGSIISFRKIISRGICQREYVTDAIVTRSSGYLARRYRTLPATFAAISRD